MGADILAGDIPKFIDGLPTEPEEIFGWLMERKDSIDILLTSGIVTLLTYRIITTAQEVSKEKNIAMTPTDYLLAPVSAMTLVWAARNIKSDTAGLAIWAAIAAILALDSKKAKVIANHPFAPAFGVVGMVAAYIDEEVGLKDNIKEFLGI